MIEEYLSAKHKKKKKKKRYTLLIVGIAILAILFVGALWVLFRSPVFRLRQVIVEGNHDVSSSDVIALLESTALRNHGFIKSLLGLKNILIWPNTLDSDEIKAIPQLASVVLSKNYLNHTITATVQERQPSAIWCAMPKTDGDGNPAGDELCYWFDGTGTMFEKAFDTQGSAIFAVHDYSQNDAAIEKKILPDVFIQNLISILNVLTASHLNIKEIALNDLSLEEIDVSTYTGPNVYFSLRFSADEDLAVLQNLIAKAGFNKLEYIDFRVENRAYYK